MILVIQTNVPGRLDVWLADRRKILAHRTKKIQWHGSERLGPMIDGVLTRQLVALRQLQRIIVVRGPGPFTAVRTGIVTANTLTWLLNLQVKGVIRRTTCTDADILRLIQQPAPRAFAQVKPSYGKAPNITRPTVRP